MRRPFIAANWKMNKGVTREALAFAADLLPRIEGVDDVDIAIAPPFTVLGDLGRALGGSPVALAAQNVHDEAQGAFTGEIAAPMLAELGCRYGIVGHSERRHLFGEDSAFVARKVRSLLDTGIGPIVCVGETLDQRDKGETEAVVECQLRESLANLSAADAERLVIAYEPVWAIGTGRSATPEMAQSVHGAIRAFLGSLFGGVGDGIRLQYGGSVKPANAAELVAQPDIDGALVGGAGLEAESFAAIIHSAHG